MRRLRSDATEEYTDSSGSGVMSPHATNLPFLFPSALTSKTRRTLIRLYSGPGKTPIPRSRNVWYENI